MPLRTTDRASPHMPGIKHLGHYLRNLRLDKNMAQVDVSDRLRISQAWVSRIESGKLILRTEEDVVLYAEAIEADVEDLLAEWRRTDKPRLSSRARPFRPILTGRTEPGECTIRDMNQQLANGIHLRTLLELVKDPIFAAGLRAACKEFKRQQ